MFGLNRFYFSKKELFLILAGILLVVIMRMNLTVSFFDPYQILLLTLLTFLAKGFISTTNDAPVFIVFLASIFLTFYYPFFQILIFYFLAFSLLKLFRLI